MLIYVEGVDGSGKTTLCKQLEELGFRTVRIERSDEWRDTDWYTLDADRSCAYIICDRSFISDLVYRTCDGDALQITDPVSYAHLLKGNRVIYCKTPTSYKDAMERGEDNITTPEKANKIKRTYETLLDMFKLFGVEVLEYNWKKDNLAKVTKFILKEVHR